MTNIKNYLSLVKFSHTIFAMPFAMIGFFLALKPTEKMINLGTHGIGWHTTIYADKTVLIIRFILVILCMVFARSAAMAFNRYLDRAFDAKNPRTAIREIPAGIISADSALIFT